MTPLLSRTIRVFLLLAICLVTLAAYASGDSAVPRRQRRATPVNNSATATQAINETRDDTARINAAHRAASSHYVRNDGAIVYVDTITGVEWIDSATIRKGNVMKFPLLSAVNVGVDIWEPVMRLFGQKHGLIGFNANVSLFNRFFPTVEIGLGTARNAPADFDYTYRSPLSVYFKLGADYNFLFNSNPDYQFFAGLRYGFAPFSWSVDDITLGSPYWKDDALFSIPSQSATAGWAEIVLGLRVRITGNIHAGWHFRYHSLIHESKSRHGEPWYIPGYGTRGQSITGSFTISYTLPLQNKRVTRVLESVTDDERPTLPNATRQSDGSLDGAGLRSLDEHRDSLPEPNDTVIVPDGNIIALL